ERRLEELVFEDQPLIAGEMAIYLCEGLGEPVLSGPEISLTWIVRAVGQPDLQIARTCLVHHVDALEIVRDCFSTYDRVNVRQAAEPVVVVLEGIAVDRSEADAHRLRVRA